MEKQNIDFKKSLGQNFLFDLNLLRAIVKDGDVGAGDTVLEIGAGAGTLTNELCKVAKKVMSFEIDKSLKPHLDKVESENKNLTITHVWLQIFLIILQRRLYLSWLNILTNLKVFWCLSKKKWQNGSVPNQTQKTMELQV